MNIYDRNIPTDPPRKQYDYLRELKQIEQASAAIDPQNLIQQEPASGADVEKLKGKLEAAGYSCAATQTDWVRLGNAVISRSGLSTGRCGLLDGRPVFAAIYRSPGQKSASTLVCRVPDDPRLELMDLATGVYWGLLTRISGASVEVHPGLQMFRNVKNVPVEMFDDGHLKAALRIVIAEHDQETRNLCSCLKSATYERDEATSRVAELSQAVADLEQFNEHLCASRKVWRIAFVILLVVAVGWIAYTVLRESGGREARRLPSSGAEPVKTLKVATAAVHRGGE